jgi:hypothetical protein
MLAESVPGERRSALGGYPSSPLGGVTLVNRVPGKVFFMVVFKYSSLH